MLADRLGMNDFETGKKFAWDEARIRGDGKDGMLYWPFL
jgi:hypothetical protein